MKRLIVNADDFGMSERVSLGILKAFDRGILTSTTVMANMPFFKKGVRMLKVRDGLGVGVHLNLTDGRPLVKCLNDIVGGDGNFSHNNARAALLGRINLVEVESELDMQVRRVMDAGLDVTHLDSHKHLHVFPGVSDVVDRIARRHGVRAVRVPDDVLADAGLLFSMQGLKRFLVKYYSKRFCGKCSRIRTTDRFFGFLETGRLDGRAMKNILSKVPYGTSELMCHPGFMDLSIKGRLKGSRVVELCALINPSLKDFVRKEGIELINYGGL